MTDGGHSDTGDRVRSLISQSGLTLYQISKRTSQSPYDTQHSWLVPETFYQLIRRGHTPHICQVIALSQITGIGLYEWLRAFGYDLEDIPRLQARIHEDHTVILPTRVYDSGATVERPTTIDASVDLGRSELVSEIVNGVESVRASQLVALTDGKLYLKVGKYDTRLLPKIVPGTIVRVDRNETRPSKGPGKARSRSRPIFAVAHLGGVSIAYVDWIGQDRIAILSRCHCHPALVYRLEEEAIVLGRVDAELRPLTTSYEHAARPGHDHAPARLTPPRDSATCLGRFLRSGRERIGLTFREAHELSLRVAREQDDPGYAVALGSLSEWEASDKLPTQLPQLLSLCAVYCVDLYAVLTAAGVGADRYVSASSAGSNPTFDSSSDLARFHDCATTIACMRHALPRLTKNNRFSWDDVLWCASGERAMDGDLEGAQLVFVDRRERRIRGRAHEANVDGPIFVFRVPQRGYLCARYFVDHDSIYLQPEPHLNLPIKQLPRSEVEVIGRATAILRLWSA